MKFIDTERFSPVAQGVDLPRKEDLFHYPNSDVLGLNQKNLIQFHLDNKIIIDDKWWKKQLYRCLYGYTVENAITEGGDFIVDGEDCFWTKDDCYIPQYDLLIKDRNVTISGRYYFYLNFAKIRGNNEGLDHKTLINPRFLAMDFFFARRSEMMREQKKDLQDVKSRQVGHSKKMAGMELSYNYLFMPMSQNIIVAGEQTDADSTFDDCLKIIDELANTQFFLRRKRGFDNKRHIRSLNGSEIFTENANDDPEALSRYSPTLIVYEEIGKGKEGWSLKVEGHVKPSIYAMGVKTGYSIYLGTGGDMVGGVKDLMKRAYAPHEHNILSFKNKWVKEGYNGDVDVCHFIPKTLFTDIDKDGNPLVEKSKETILAEREKLSASGKYLHTSTHAIYLDDVFQSNTAGYFGAERVRLLNERYNYILTHKTEQITRKGHLEWVKPGDMSMGVVFVDATEEELQAETWWCEILEEPEIVGGGVSGDVYKNLYVSGTDTYNQDESVHSDSQGAFVTYKKWRNNSDSPFFNTWVCMIYERPSISTGGMDLFFEHTLMASMYYNSENNHEWVNPLFFNYYEKKNATRYLMERPTLAFAGQIKQMKSANRYGTDKSLKPQVLAYLREKLDVDQINRMYFLRQIYALARFRYNPGDKYNCDITIATAESMIGYKEIEEATVVDAKKTANSDVRVWREVNGVLTRVAI